MRRIGDALVDFMRWLDPAWRKNLREIEEWRAYEKGFVDAREGFGHAGRGGSMFVHDEWEEYARKRHETEGTKPRDFLTSLPQSMGAVVDTRQDVFAILEEAIATANIVYPRDFRGTLREQRVLPSEEAIHLTNTVLFALNKARFKIVPIEKATDANRT